MMTYKDYIELDYPKEIEYTATSKDGKISSGELFVPPIPKQLFNDVHPQDKGDLDALYVQWVEMIAIYQGEKTTGGLGNIKYNGENEHRAPSITDRTRSLVAGALNELN